MQRFSLRQKLILGMLVLGTLLAVAASALQMFWDYEAELDEIQSEISIVENGGLPLLRSSLWALDDNQTRLTLEGIVSLPKIGYVHVIGEEIDFSAGTALPPKAPAISHTFPLIFMDGERPQHLGELHVYAPLEPVYQKLIHRAGMVLLINLGRTLLVAFLLGYFFDRLVTRHVRRVAKYLEQTPYASDAPQLSLERSPHSRDELDELTLAVNHLRTRLNIYDREIRDEKSRYYALVENNPEAIWRCEIQKPISVTSPTNVQFKELARYAVLAEINDAAADLTPGQSRHAVIGAEWHKLPFLHETIWRELVERHYRVKDLISHFTDADGNERFFSNSLTCLIADGHIKTIWGIAIEITQRVTAQRQLEQREQQLSLSQARLAEAQALAHMGHWVYNTDTDALQVSDEFARIYGFDPLQGQPTWPGLTDRIHPDDRGYVLKALSDPKMEAVGAEHRIIWPNGEERHVQAIARKNIVQGHVAATFGIIMDITDRRRAEEDRKRSQQALIESEARMAEAQAIAHLGHWILDQNTQTLSCSDEFFRLFGHPPQSFQPTLQDFFQQVHPDDRERIHQIFNKLTQRALTHEYRIIRRDGELRYMRGTVTPFYSGGRDIKRVFGIAMDITEQKLAELTSAQQQKQLLRADKLASLGTMVAGVAHEINNPNHLIQMNAELLESFTHNLLGLLDEYLGDERDGIEFNGMSINEIITTTPELLNDIKASTRRIDRIVKDLKNFSRPRDNAEMLPLNLNQVIDKTRTLLSSTLDKRRIALEYELAPELPRILGDSQQLEQVLINLVTNALDAVNSDSGRVLVRTASEENQVICEVIDNGSGISAENLRHIFDPFFTTKQESGGTGLGLPISFRLIREHGGQLEVISAPNAGTTMRISLPVHASPERAPRSPAP
jgi:PAS domain S-box